MSDIKLNAICTECKNNTVFYDKHRAEIYCSKCGLVLAEFSKVPSNNLLQDYNFNDFKEMQFYISADDLFPNRKKWQKKKYQKLQ